MRTLEHFAKIEEFYVAVNLPERDAIKSLPRFHSLWRLNPISVSHTFEKVLTFLRGRQERFVSFKDQTKDR